MKDTLEIPSMIASTISRIELRINISGLIPTRSGKASNLLLIGLPQKASSFP